MAKYIGCDMHKKYSVFVGMDEQGRLNAPVSVANDSLELASYLKTLEEGTPVAVEASGGWYWFVDRLEQAGLDVRLVNPLEAKKRMKGRHKTDSRDAAGLALLLRNGTLPEVWIRPAELRDDPGRRTGLAAPPIPASGPALGSLASGALSSVRLTISVSDPALRRRLRRRSISISSLTPAAPT